MANQDELPLDARLRFSIKAEVPATFSRKEKIEIATTIETFHLLLGIADGGLTLQDPRTAVGEFDSEKSFGKSAFGPLQLRPVDDHGVKGDWIPLATLIRVPALAELNCPDDESQQCTLKGSGLFFLAAVASDSQFSSAVSVPEGFISDSLHVPHPVNGTLYIKLRGDPSQVNTASVPISGGKPTKQSQR
jgi:hypothetical protein